MGELAGSRALALRSGYARSERVDGTPSYSLLTRFARFFCAQSGTKGPPIDSFRTSIPAAPLTVEPRNPCFLGVRKEEWDRGAPASPSAETRSRTGLSAEVIERSRPLLWLPGRIEYEYVSTYEHEDRAHAAHVDERGPHVCQRARRDWVCTSVRRMRGRARLAAPLSTGRRLRA